MTSSWVISWDLINAWETWIVDVPDDAPDPITPEWINENFDKLEFQQIKEDGFNQMVNPQIQYKWGGFK